MWTESQCTIMVDQKQRDNVEYFSSLGDMITNDASCTREIKARNAMANGAFYKKKTLFASKMDLNLRGKPVKVHLLCSGYLVFPGSQAAQALTSYPHLAPRLKSRAIHLLHLCAFISGYRVNSTFCK